MQNLYCQWVVLKIASDVGAECVFHQVNEKHIRANNKIQLGENLSISEKKN